MPVSNLPSDSFDRSSSLSKTWLVGLAACVAIASCAGLLLGFWLGQSNTRVELPALMAGTAASSDTMAVATGQISGDADGIFFLDFITGDLQCLVYYPRAGTFGAHYYTKVNLGGAGKNSKYLMVTGQAITTATSGGPRPGASLVYVTDVTSGMFAAYAVPWDRNAESSGRPQSGPLVFVGGGPIRNFQLPDPAQNKPAAVVDPNKK